VFLALNGEADALSIARVMGISVAKIAEAISQVVADQRQDAARDVVEPDRDGGHVGGDGESGATDRGPARRPLPPSPDLRPPPFRGLGLGRTSPACARCGCVVGFVDLTGFTSLSSRLSPSELGHLLSMFESQTSQVIDHYGGRVVKFIGDEVMFVAPTTEQAATIAAVIVAGAPDDSRRGLALPTARAWQRWRLLRGTR